MKSWMVLAGILLTVLLVSGCTETSKGTDNLTAELNQQLIQAQETIAQQEQQILDLNQQIINLTQQIEDLNQQVTDLETDAEFNEYFQKGTLSSYNGGYNNDIANYNYDLWGFYYDQGYYADAIEYCVLARDAWALSNTDYGNARAYFEEANKTAKGLYPELIDYYIEAFRQAIDINWAMYEACEYFESACNYYNQGIQATGDSELESGNDKIRLHDSMVVPYNELSAKITVLEDKIGL